MTPLSWRLQRSRVAPSARILALLAIEGLFQVSRRDGFILLDLRHVNLNETSPKIKSYHCSFNGNFPFSNIPPLLPSERILDLYSCQA